MSGLQPITHTDEFLVAVLKELVLINNALTSIEGELQQLNKVATQKPSIQLDVAQLADKLTLALQQQTKSGKSIK